MILKAVITTGLFLISCNLPGQGVDSLSTWKPQQWTKVTTSGLSLTLQASVVKGTTDTVKMQVSLINDSSEPVTLVANWAYEGESDGFVEFFKQNICVTTMPPTYVTTAQTAGAMRRSPQPEYSLKPGAKLVVDWTEICGCLKTREYLACFAPCLREPGRYLIQAHFAARFPGLVYEPLASEPVSLDFGRSSETPVRTYAEVIEMDEATSTAIISGGSNHGLQVGQKWSIFGSLFHCWDLEITSVDAEKAKADVLFQGKIHIPEGEAVRLKTGQKVWRKDTMRLPECLSVKDNPDEQKGFSGPGAILASIRTLFTRQWEWVIAGLVLLLIVTRALKMRPRVQKI